MWQQELQKEMAALAGKYGFTMMAFAATTKDSNQALVMAGGNYDQLIYGLSGIVEKIAGDEDLILPEDILADLEEITIEKRV